MIPRTGRCIVLALALLTPAASAVDWWDCAPLMPGEVAIGGEDACERVAMWTDCLIELEDPEAAIACCARQEHQMPMRVDYRLVCLACGAEARVAVEVSDEPTEAELLRRELVGIRDELRLLRLAIDRYTAWPDSLVDAPCLWWSDGIDTLEVR